MPVGDSIPDIELMEDSPGNKVSIPKLLKGKGLIIGVPAAFSPSCSESHIPGYINYKNLKDAGDVFVVSVNDPFCCKSVLSILGPNLRFSMKAWAHDLDADKKSGIRFLADPDCSFTKALDLDFDATPVLGNHRSKRYALVIEDGKVKEAHVEPDNTGMSVSVVDKVLG
ncbi:peroxiredoxin [Aureobasidium pullulans]|uniref:Peroxiredoxin n=1 Tax=Aureobasidium pullulans TaxID=5580 RepID=A0A4S9XTC7_AURPU|nr:peroxiredoxin [Aureobasidium pullulans]